MNGSLERLRFALPTSGSEYLRYGRSRHPVPLIPSRQRCSVRIRALSLPGPSLVKLSNVSSARAPLHDREMPRRILRVMGIATPQGDSLGENVTNERVGFDLVDRGGCR